MGLGGYPKHWIAGSFFWKDGEQVGQPNEKIGNTTFSANPIKDRAVIGAATAANPARGEECIDGRTRDYLVNFGVGDNQGDVVNLTGYCP